MTSIHASSFRRSPRPARPPTHRLLAAAAAGVMVIGLAACGSDDNSSDATVSTATTDNPAPATSQGTTEAPTSDVTQPTATAMTETTEAVDTGNDAAATVPAAPITNAITITTPGMSYDVSGPLRPGVAAITLTNASNEAHMMAVGRLAPGVTVDQIKAALAQSEDATGALLVDGLDNSVYGTPAPVGAGQSSTVTATDLAPGDYGIICFFTDDDGTPHFAMGMVNTFTVEGEPATETPDSDGTITIDDNGITMPADFTGSGTFLVTNDGTTQHSISIARLEDGTTLDAYYGFVGGQMNSGKAIDGGGGVMVGGVDSLLPGQSAYLTLDLSSGHYGYLSTEDANGPALPAQSGEFDVS